MPIKTHGMSKHKFYKRWKDMRQRCLNKDNKHFKHYGARGITVCDEWKEDAKAFIDYISTLEHAGKPGYSIDREDNDKNYEPGNIRWATQKEQNNNRRFLPTNTGEPLISEDKNRRGKRFLISRERIRFSTLEEALAYREENYGF